MLSDLCVSRIQVPWSRGEGFVLQAAGPEEEEKEEGSFNSIDEGSCCCRIVSALAIGVEEESLMATAARAVTAKSERAEASFPTMLATTAVRIRMRRKDRAFTAVDIHRGVAWGRLEREDELSALLI